MRRVSPTYTGPSALLEQERWDSLIDSTLSTLHRQCTKALGGDCKARVPCEDLYSLGFYLFIYF